MTNVKSEMIAEVILAQDEFSKQIISMDPEAAAKELQGKGYDLSTEDLVEFYEELKAASEKMSSKGELDESDLDEVSGGCRKCLVAGIGAGLMIGVVIAGW